MGSAGFYKDKKFYQLSIIAPAGAICPCPWPPRGDGIRGAWEADSHPAARYFRNWGVKWASGHPVPDEEVRRSGPANDEEVKPANDGAGGGG